MLRTSVIRHILAALVIFLVIVLLGCGSSGSDEGATTGPGAQLTIKETEFQFGNISRNVKVSHEFWLYSTGEDTLKITGVKVGCGCTKAPPKKDVLPPGDSTALEVTYTSSRIPSYPRKSVAIHSNESDSAYQKVWIKAIVIPWADSVLSLQVNPYRLKFSNRGSKSLRVNVENTSENDYRIEVVDCPPTLSVETPEILRSGDNKDLTINRSGPPIDDTYYKSITLEAVGADTVRFTLPVRLEQ